MQLFLTRSAHSIPYDVDVFLRQDRPTHHSCRIYPHSLQPGCQWFQWFMNAWLYSHDSFRNFQTCFHITVNSTVRNLTESAADEAPLTLAVMQHDTERVLPWASTSQTRHDISQSLRFSQSRAHHVFRIDSCSAMGEHDALCHEPFIGSAEWSRTVSTISIDTNAGWPFVDKSRMCFLKW
jgi:hypothetical protein